MLAIVANFLIQPGHTQTDWLKSTGRAIGPLLAERPVLDYLDPVG